MSKLEGRWQVQLKRQPEKMLRRLPKTLTHRIDSALLALRDNPFPANSKALIGLDNLYRLRVGDWRIVYTVKNKQLLILVIRIAPRGAAYKNL